MDIYATPAGDIDNNMAHSETGGVVSYHFGFINALRSDDSMITMICVCNDELA